MHDTWPCSCLWEESWRDMYGGFLPKKDTTPHISLAWLVYALPSGLSMLATISANGRAGFPPGQGQWSCPCLLLPVACEIPTDIGATPDRAGHQRRRDNWYGSESSDLINHKHNRSCMLWSLPQIKPRRTFISLWIIRGGGKMSPGASWLTRSMQLKRVERGAGPSDWEGWKCAACMHACVHAWECEISTRYSAADKHNCLLQLARGMLACSPEEGERSW